MAFDQLKNLLERKVKSFMDNPDQILKRDDIDNEAAMKPFVNAIQIKIVMYLLLIILAF
jgi:hypothetical protein